MASMTSSIPAAQLDRVFGGIDTHQDTHTAALVDSAGRLLGSAVFPTTQAGYRQLLGWMGSAGTLARVGVEGTGSYGAGICRRLSAEGIEVVEVNRPDRSQRRRRGKIRCFGCGCGRRSSPHWQPHRGPEVPRWPGGSTAGITAHPGLSGEGPHQSLAAVGSAAGERARSSCVTRSGASPRWH